MILIIKIYYFCNSVVSPTVRAEAKTIIRENTVSGWNGSPPTLPGSDRTLPPTGTGSRSSRPCSACGISRCPTGTHPGWQRPAPWICRRQGVWETSAATIKVRWRSCHAPTPQAGNTNGRTAYPAFARSKIVLSSPILMKPATFSPSTQRGRSSAITRHISGHR